VTDLLLQPIGDAFHEGRHPAHGFEATREAAMQAFARCCFRETQPVGAAARAVASQMLQQPLCLSTATIASVLHGKSPI
jgi:hypothetical protein